MFEREHVEVRAQRRDLHRDALHVGAPQTRAYRVQTRVGFVVTEDRLTEQVHVAVDALAAPAREVLPERRIGGGQDDPARLGLDAGAHDWRDRARRPPGAGRGEAERGAVDETERAGETVVDE